MLLFRRERKSFWNCSIALSRARLDFEAVTRQLAFLQHAPLFFVLLVVGGLYAERARAVALGVLAPRRKQAVSRVFGILFDLFAVFTERAQHILRAAKPLKLLPVARQAGLLTVAFRVFLLDERLHFVPLAVLPRQYLVQKLTNALVKPAAQGDFVLFFATERVYLTCQRVDLPVLLFEPQQVYVRHLFVDFLYLTRDFLAPQIIALPFGHDLLHEIRLENRRFLAGNRL